MTFAADGEVYQWNKVTTSINNLILGKIYVDHGGIMRVRNATTGLTAKLRFKETGMIFDRDPRQVGGGPGGGRPVLALGGVCGRTVPGGERQDLAGWWAAGSDGGAAASAGATGRIFEGLGAGT